MSQPARTLILAWGNRSRGDDALGPLLLDRLNDRIDPGKMAQRSLECLEEFQLQLENVVDLEGRERVLFVDADPHLSAEYHVERVEPSDLVMSYTSHQMDPANLLSLYQQMYGAPLPTCWLLAIRATQFDLGAALTPQAYQALPKALDWVLKWIP